MIDLTPLDVRNKRGDFRKLLRGYDPEEVDIFLELVAERLEDLVRENIQLRERSETLQQQVSSQSGREQAVQDALVTAQELRADIQSQAQREADHVLSQAETEARRLIAEAQAQVRTHVRDAERALERGRDSMEEMERRRLRFLKEFRQLLEREMDVVAVEEERAPLEDRSIELNLGGGRVGGDEEDEQPPMDVPVDELSAAYDEVSTGDVADDDVDDDSEADSESESESGELFLSFGESEPAPDERPE
jgi:cell division initiation protein